MLVGFSDHVHEATEAEEKLMIGRVLTWSWYQGKSEAEARAVLEGMSAGERQRVLLRRHENDDRETGEAPDRFHEIG